MGLLDFGQGPNGGLLGRMQNLPTVQAPAAAPRGPGFWRTVDGLLAQRSIGDIRDDYAAQQQAQAMAQQKLAEDERRRVELSERSQGLNNEQRLAMLLNPAELGKSFAARSEPRKVNLTNVNGVLVDQTDPENANRFVPKVPDGAVPLYDQKGNIVATRLLDGTIQAVGALAGAEAGARAAATAPYDFLNVPRSDGATQMMSKASLASGALGSGVGGAALGRTQTPSEARTVEAADVARQGLPAAIQKAQTALDLISNIKGHAALKMRTGGWAMTPAIPGTAGADFDSMTDQLKGKAFLEAFDSLKGGGAISEREGTAATDAIARLNQRQTPEGYTKALDDLAQVIQAGATRMAAKASQGSQPAPGGYSRAAIEAEARRRGMIR